MRIPDDQLPQWWELLAERRASRATRLEAKLELARRFIVRRSHGEEAAQAAEEHFTRVVRRRRGARGRARGRARRRAIPCICRRCSSTELGVASTSEARRLIEQGGVKLNGEPAAGLDLPRAALAGALLQVGKRRFAPVLTP